MSHVTEKLLWTASTVSVSNEQTTDEAPKQEDRENKPETTKRSRDESTVIEPATFMQSKRSKHSFSDYIGASFGLEMKSELSMKKISRSVHFILDSWYLAGGLPVFSQSKHDRNIINGMRTGNLKGDVLTARRSNSKRPLSTREISVDDPLLAHDNAPAILESMRIKAAANLPSLSEAPRAKRSRELLESVRRDEADEADEADLAPKVLKQLTRPVS